MVLNVITPRWPDGRKSFSQSGATEEAGCWWQQRCDPRSCSLYEGKKELLGTKFWLKNHRLQPVVETNHPPIEVFFFFFYEWLGICDVMPALAGPSCWTETDVTGYLIGGYRAHRAHSVTSTRAFLCGRRLRWKRATPTGRTKLLSRRGESLDVRRGRNVAFLCNCSQSHAHNTDLLCIVTCA